MALRTAPRMLRIPAWSGDNRGRSPFPSACIPALRAAPSKRLTRMEWRQQKTLPIPNCMHSGAPESSKHSTRMKWRQQKTPPIPHRMYSGAPDSSKHAAHTRMEWRQQEAEILIAAPPSPWPQHEALRPSRRTWQRAGEWVGRENRTPGKEQKKRSGHSYWIAGCARIQRDF